jgi:hypothetical protein
MQIWANSKSIQITQPESSYHTLFGLTGHYPALWILFGLASNSNRFHRELLPDFVRSYQTLSDPSRILPEIQIWAQQLDSLESPINIPPPPTTLPSCPLRSLGAKAHMLHLQRPKTPPLEISLQVLDLGIEWSKDSSFVCDSPPQACLDSWIFILHTYYSWSCAPRWLEVALELPLCVMSLGEFVLPIFVIVSSSRSVFVTTWVRKGLRETWLFVSSSMRT